MAHLLILSSFVLLSIAMTYESSIAAPPPALISVAWVASCDSLDCTVDQTTVGNYGATLFLYCSTTSSAGPWQSAGIPFSRLKGGLIMSYGLKAVPTNTLPIWFSLGTQSSSTGGGTDIGTASVAIEILTSCENNTDPPCTSASLPYHFGINDHKSWNYVNPTGTDPEITNSPSHECEFVDNVPGYPSNYTMNRYTPSIKATWNGEFEFEVTGIGQNGIAHILYGLSQNNLPIVNPDYPTLTGPCNPTLTNNDAIFVSVNSFLDPSTANCDTSVKWLQLQAKQGTCYPGTGTSGCPLYINCNQHYFVRVERLNTTQARLSLYNYVGPGHVYTTADLVKEAPGTNPCCLTIPDITGLQWFQQGNITQASAGRGMTGWVDSVNIWCEDSSICADTTPYTNETCCDTAFMNPVGLNSFGKTYDTRAIYVVNHKGTPIHDISIAYYDCLGNQILSPAAPSFGSKSLNVVRNVPYLNRTLSGSDYTSSSSGPSVGYISGLDNAPFKNSNDLISFDLGLPCSAIPSCWSIRLTIVHTDPSVSTGLDTCYVTLPNWNVCPPIGPTHWTEDTDIKAFRLKMTLTEDTPAVRYVTFTTADSTDVIVGGTGGYWASAVNSLGANGTIVPDSARVLIFVQSKNSALFALKADSNGFPIPPTFNIFVEAGQNANVLNYKPKLIIGAYDENGGLLSTDSATASKTVSIVNPPSAAPSANGVEINSVIPNPGTSTVEITYTLGTIGAAHLELFNTLGQSVGLLSDGFQTQGEHQIDYNVIALSGGTYYLRLSEGSEKTSAIVTVIH